MQHNLVPETPAEPNWGVFIAATTTPMWTIPMATKITAGEGVEEGAVNGIGFTETGDLLLYRKITPTDKFNYPMLIHIQELWMVFELPCPEIV